MKNWLAEGIASDVNVLGYFKSQTMEQVQEELLKKCATFLSTEIIQIKVCFAKLQRKSKFQISYRSGKVQTSFKSQNFCIVSSLKPNHFKKQSSSSSFLLTYGNLQVQNGNEVLNRVVSCHKCMEIACWVLQASLYYLR